MKNKNERKFDIKADDIHKYADLYFDPNVENKEKGGKISGVQHSEDGKYMSFLMKKKGSDWGTLFVKDMDTRKDIPD